MNKKALQLKYFSILFDRFHAEMDQRSDLITMFIVAVHNTFIRLERLDLWNIFPVILKLCPYKEEQTCTFMDTKASFRN